MEQSPYTEEKLSKLQTTSNNIINWLKLIIDIYPIEKGLLKFINKKIKRAEMIIEKGGNLW